MAIDTSDFKTGLAIYLDREVYQIVDFQHVKPGKGGAFVRTKLRRLRTGATLEKTFRAGERMDVGEISFPTAPVSPSRSPSISQDNAPRFGQEVVAR